MVKVGQGIPSRWHSMSEGPGPGPRSKPGVSGELEKRQEPSLIGPAAGPPQSTCRWASPLFLSLHLAHSAPLLPASASLVFVPSQSRGLSSTHCLARATGSVSPAWTPTRCLPLPHSSWTSCSTLMGKAPSGVRGCRVGGDETWLCRGAPEGEDTAVPRKPALFSFAPRILASDA